MHKSFISKYLCFNTVLGPMIDTVIEIYTGQGATISQYGGGQFSQRKGGSVGGWQRSAVRNHF